MIGIPRRILGAAAVWLALAVGSVAAQDTADEDAEEPGEVWAMRGATPMACGVVADKNDVAAPVPVRGLPPGFRVLHLAREDFETHTDAGTYVDAATGQLFAGYVVTLSDGSKRFGLHNLHTGFHVQLIRPDMGGTFPGPTTESFWRNTRGMERRIGLKAELRPVEGATIIFDGTVETAGHRHLIQPGRIGTFDSRQSWFSYICRSVDGRPAEAFFLALVQDEAGRVVPDACAAVRERGAAALLAQPPSVVSHLVTEDDRLLTFVDDRPVVVVDAGLDGHDIRVDGGVLVVARSVIIELERVHGTLGGGMDEEWSTLSDEQISRHVLERACRTGPRP